MLCIFSTEILAVTREVGPGKTYASPALAANAAQAGDTILIYPSTYVGGNFIGNKHGQANAYIYFIGVDTSTVLFQGSSQAFHFSDVSYIHIENITVIGQTGNGINIDDGSSFESPSHHIVIRNCRFLNMNASGNNDLLKMSGVDNFEISQCVFRNGSAGGSGIDMVGCHQGLISRNSFENQGSNCIQAKGGTQYLTISRNKFKNGGQRTLNLGGSTGLAFFRPQDAVFEAADIDVYANIIIGSTAAIAYVGCVRVHVVNNTIINPSNWVARILQETVDINRFLPCGQNTFKNNVVYYGTISTHVNVGSNTAPTTFIFSNNLWYKHTNPGSSTPSLPVSENNGIVGQHPQFVNLNTEDFKLMSNSPAIDEGTTSTFLEDYSGFSGPLGITKDIGAYEFTAPTLLGLDGNTNVCIPSTTQEYQVKSLFAHHFGWSITGGNILPYVNTDTIVYINWNDAAPSHSINITSYDAMNNLGNNLIFPVQLTQFDTLAWEGQNSEWMQRSNWDKKSFPQACHHVVIDGFELNVIIAPGDTAIIKSLDCHFGNVLGITAGGILKMLND